MSHPLVKPLSLIAATAVAIVLIVVAILTFYGAWYDNWIGLNDFYTPEGCNIAVVPVVGEIISADGGTYEPKDFEDLDLVSSDHVVANIEAAANNPDIAGLILRLDSPGGTPVASEIIMEAVQRLNIPSVALIREYGTSGAYLAATGADTIIASAMSTVGGIGVNSSYLDNSKKNMQEGVEYVQLTSAEYKDYGSPDRPMTAAERKLVEQDLSTLHNLFVEHVAKNRQLDIEAVKALANGATLLGQQALNNGLIDQLGNQDTARTWLAEQLDLEADSIVMCE
jgi:protease IV